MKLFVALWTILFVASGATLDLAGNTRDPFAQPARARIFVFIRSDCPVSNRYAPELRHIADIFAAGLARHSGTYAVLVMGIAIVAGVKRSSGYIAVFGWWAIIVLFGVGYAAIAG